MNRHFVTFVAIALLATSCHTTAPKAQAPRPVKLTEVISLDQLDKSFTGIVGADQFSDLAFKMSGPLVSLNVDEGESVKAGQLIAVIDPLDFQLELEARKASYLNAQSQLERSRKLLSKQATSRQDFEGAEANYINAKAAYEYAQSMLSQTELTAPFAGFIQKKHVENYQKVSAGQAIVTLINPNKLLINFTLPDNNLAYLTGSNPTIYVEFDNYKGELFKTRVKEYVEASPDGSGLPVSLYIDDPKFNLDTYKVAVGFSCRVLLHIPMVGEESNLIGIPLSAVVSCPESGTLSVFVYDSTEGAVFERTITQEGMASKELVMVSSGISGGEQVVSAGATRLVDGEQVKVLTK